MLTGERRRSAFPQHSPIQVIVRIRAGTSTNPKTNISQNFGTISLSRIRTQLGSGRVEFPKPHLCLCRHQRWFHQLPWKEALRERFACLQLQAAKDKQDFKNHLTQRSDREGKLSASALDGETDRTTSWSEFPCRPLGAALSASLLSCLIQILTA